MDKELSKAFILLDVLFGMVLMIAVMLLCGYFRHMAGGFYAASAQCRALASAYYAVHPGLPRVLRESEMYREVDTTLLLTQATNDIVVQRRGALNVVRGKGALSNTFLVTGLTDAEA